MNMLLLLWAVAATVTTIFFAVRFFGQRKKFRAFCEEVRSFHTASVPPQVLFLTIVLAGLAIWKRDEIKKFLEKKLTEKK